MRALLAPFALAAALLVPAAAQGAATPPPQPESGPGGSDYPHAGFRVSEGGSGDDAWFVFEPTDPRPKSAPLSIVMHGYFEFSGYENLRAVAEHTARKGNVVIYPRWQTGVNQPCPGAFDIEPCVRSAVNGINGALAYLAADRDRVQPDVARASYFAHSFGGIVTANMANRWKTLGIPEPKVVFLEDPHDGGQAGPNEPALDDDLGGIPPTSLVQCHSSAEGVIAGTSVGTSGPQSARDGSCNQVFPRLSSVPAANKDLVLTSVDDHGDPDLTAEHGVCNGVNLNAYDWGFCWKVFDALRSCRFSGTDCEHALGDTPQHRYIGTWSDGVPIIGLKIQEEAPIRIEPVPPREPAPPAGEPAPSAATDAAPTVRITRVGRRRIRGTASDDRGVRRVVVAVVRRTSGGCSQMTRTGRFTRLRRCQRPTRFLRARGTNAWSLRLPVRLAPGSYRVVVRASDRAGQRTQAMKVAALDAAGAQQAAAQSCPDGQDEAYVCGVNNPEDLIRVDGTPFVLSGNMGNTDDEGGGFYSVHATTRELRELEPSFTSPAQDAYRDCPGPPDPALFSVHGLDLKTEQPAGSGASPVRTVYAVNHAGRESIEVFRLEASDAGLALTWIGCALVPESYAANSVAALPDGGFAVTVPVRSEAELLNAGAERPTGAVYRWSPSGGWRELPDVELSFPNGILASPDGALLYVAGYTEQAVARLSAETGKVDGKVEVPFNPDNLRWAPDGDILATGQNENPAVVQFTCVSTSVETCEVPTGVSKVDPATLQATTLFERPGDERFGAGTSSIVVGDELWIGSFRAQRLLRVPSRVLKASIGTRAEEAAGGPPQLRLVRRCARGRLRVSLRGDVDRIRDVSFKFGRRLIARDTAAPFRKRLPRRALRRTKARRLRAVAYLHGADPVRVILSRTLPRCRA